MQPDQLGVPLDINAILKQNCSNNNTPIHGVSKQGVSKQGDSKQGNLETWMVTTTGHSYKKWSRVQYRINGEKINKWFMRDC